MHTTNTMKLHFLEIYAATFLFTACNSILNMDESSVEFERIQTDGFHINIIGTDVFRDQEAWVRLWEEYWGVYDSRGERTPPPAIDFSEEMVVAVFYGAQPTSCQDLDDTIRSVIKKSGRIEIALGFVNLEGLCDAPGWPSIMLKMEKSNLPVLFTGELPN